MFAKPEALEGGMPNPQKLMYHGSPETLDTMTTRLVLIARYLVIALALILSGCATRQPPPPEARPSPEPPEAATPALTPSQPAPTEAQKAMAAQLLAQAEGALSRGRLVPPARDNAYDLLRAALAIDPGQAEVRAALDGVLLAYMDQVRTIMRRGRLREAQDMVDVGEDLFPNTDLFRGLRTELNQAVQAHQSEQLAAMAADDLEGERVPLSIAELNQRSEALQERLGEIAERVARTQESVMIWARTDAEGRWIYQTMQARVSDYRIRGDIRLSSRPFLQLLEPL